MQQMLALFDDLPPVEVLRTKKENQWFDRKSFRIQATELSKWLIGFANADGGRIIIGIHDGQVEGVVSSIDHQNDLLQAALNYTVPPVRHIYQFLECINREGRPDHLLLFDIDASDFVHRNRSQECFLRIGDENRRLSMVEERELMFGKGEAQYDKSIVEDVGMEDLDMDAIRSYAQQYKVSDVHALMRARGLYIDSPSRKGVTQAGLLLFGKVPPIWSYVRYLRYDGLTAETGTRSNLLTDIRLEGTLPALIEQAKVLLTEELKVIRLTATGRFQSVLSLPEFAWLEAIVNAVTHRSYNLRGDGIRVKQFADRLEVESPGRLPGLVRVQNIRKDRFSRNPHISRVLADTTDYVREANEGVRRMFEEMEQLGLRAPDYKVTDSSVSVTLYKQLGEAKPSGQVAILPQLAYLQRLIGSATLTRLLATFYDHKKASTRDVSQVLGVSSNTARKYLAQLAEAGLIVEELKAKFDPKAVWAITESPFWTRFAQEE